MNVASSFPLELEMRSWLSKIWGNLLCPSIRSSCCMFTCIPSEESCYMEGRGRVACCILWSLPCLVEGMRSSLVWGLGVVSKRKKMELLSLAENTKRSWYHSLYLRKKKIIGLAMERKVGQKKRKKMRCSVDRSGGLLRCFWSWPKEDAHEKEGCP